eukprot:superscaffoldBa00003434_g16933
MDCSPTLAAEAEALLNPPLAVTHLRVTDFPGLITARGQVVEEDKNAEDWQCVSILGVLEEDEGLKLLLDTPKGDKVFKIDKTLWEVQFFDFK